MLKKFIKEIVNKVTNSPSINDKDVVYLGILNKDGSSTPYLVKVSDLKSKILNGLSITSIAFNKNTVTQVASIGSQVTVNSDCGTITTVSASTAAQSIDSFAFNNSFIKSNSVILLFIRYDGIGGFPVVKKSSQIDGQIIIDIFNASTTQALNDILKIDFLIIN